MTWWSLVWPFGSCAETTLPEGHQEAAEEGLADVPAQRWPPDKAPKSVHLSSAKARKSGSLHSAEGASVEKKSGVVPAGSPPAAGKAHLRLLQIPAVYSPDLRSPSTGVARTPPPTEGTSPGRTSPPHQAEEYDEAAPVFRPHSPGTPSRSPSRSPSRLSRVTFPLDDSAAAPSSARSITPTGGGEFMQAVTKGRIEMEKGQEDSDADRSGGLIKAGSPGRGRRSVDAKIPALPSFLRQALTHSSSPLAPLASEKALPVRSPSPPGTPSDDDQPFVGATSIENSDLSFCSAPEQQDDSNASLNAFSPSGLPAASAAGDSLGSSDEGPTRAITATDTSVDEAETPGTTQKPSFLTGTRGTSTPAVTGLDNPLINYRESRKIRPHDTPFEERIQKTMRKEAAFVAKKKAEFRERLSGIVQAQAEQLRSDNSNRADHSSRHRA
ncbi:hypothetical protein WJX73_008865 [Symbiochloris irregularis]|uniref:Uncharacterized protein n=1 Tax=Symbiochloris irregularis TaxID=706552 RepID=A0AAW1NZB3_9CHLO